MSTARRPRRVLALAGAALALVLASTGGAVAGSMITGKQVKDNTLTSADIKNRTIKPRDLSPQALASLDGTDGADGADGMDGANGADGADGAPGLDGADGVAGYEVVTSFGTPVASGVQAYTEAYCPLGKVALGGGSGWGGADDPGNVVTTSLPYLALRDESGQPIGTQFPDGSADMWAATGYHASPDDARLLVFVICAELAP